MRTRVGSPRDGCDRLTRTGARRRYGRMMSPADWTTLGSLLVAALALLTTYGVARAQERERRREERYRELRDVYDSLSRGVARLISYLSGGRARANVSIQWDPRMSELAHAGHMLRMYRASDDVVLAWAHMWEAMQELVDARVGTFISASAAEREKRLEEVQNRLPAVFDACHDHLESIWPHTRPPRRRPARHP